LKSTETQVAYASTIPALLISAISTR